MKYSGCEGIAVPLLTSALGGGEWSALRPSHFTPRKAPGNHWIRGWMSLRVGLPRTEPWQLAHSPSQYRLSYPGPALCDRT
jgi:hypothetical protein